MEQIDFYFFKVSKYKANKLKNFYEECFAYDDYWYIKVNTKIEMNYSFYINISERDYLTAKKMLILK